MGNQLNGQKGHSLGKKPYPFLVNKIKLNTKIQTQGVNFEPSPYNIQEDKFSVIPVMDKNIRNSEFCYVPMNELSNSSLPLIREYLSKLNNFDEKYDQINKQWRMTRYNQQGHFLQHCDRQKFIEGHRHFGTQIFLPPYSQSKYEGGQLKITYQGEVTQILSDEQLWTHVILPLGIEHQVKKVIKGVRISYVKEIWVIEEEENIETDQDKEIRENAINRRRYMMVD